MAQLPAITTRGKRIGEIINDYQPPFGLVPLGQPGNPYTQVGTGLPPGANALSQGGAPPVPQLNPMDVVQRFQTFAQQQNPALGQPLPDVQGQLQAYLDSLKAEAAARPTELDRIYTQNQAAKAGTEANLQYLQQNPAPTVGWNQMQVPEMPQAQYPTPPERQTPQMNPLVTLLAGLGAAISPQHAGQFLGNAVQGTVNTGQQGYEDQQRLYQQRLQQLQAQHQDALTKWNANVRFIEENATGQQRADLLNAAAKEKRILDTGALLGAGAQQGAVEGAFAPGGPLEKDYTKVAGLKADVEASFAKYQQAVQSRTAAGAAKKDYEDNVQKLYSAVLASQTKQSVVYQQQQGQNERLGNKMAGWDVPDGQGGTIHIKGTSELATERIESQKAIGAAHDAARVEVARIRASTPDRIQLRAVLDKQLTDAGTNMRAATIARENFLRVYPEPENRNTEYLRGRYRELTDNLRHFEAQHEEFGKAANELRGTPQGNAAPAPSKSPPQQNEPPRPANVPPGFIFRANGPKGAGWYRN